MTLDVVVATLTCKLDSVTDTVLVASLTVIANGVSDTVTLDSLTATVILAILDSLCY